MTRVASGKTSAHPREPASPHAWLDALRRAGADRFASVGFPKTTDEEWRLTNVAPIAKTKFAAPSPTPSDEALELVRQGSFGADAQLELVFVNGRHVPALSHANRRSLGVSVGTIQQFLAENSAFLQENLGNIADITLTPFVAQNTASIQDGAVVHVSKRSDIEGPIHLLFVSTTGPEPTQSFPRVLVVADEGSQVTLVESHVGGSGVHFTNAVTEILAASGCIIDYNRMQQGADQAFAITALCAHLGASSQLISHAATLGGKLIRKRQAVIAVMAAGNRDPEKFPDPDRLDITRKDNRHLAFGWGVHFCFGAPLARIEGQIVFEEMLRRLPNWILEPEPLVWRTNLGLRGLTRLPIRFGDPSAGNNATSPAGSARNNA